MSGGVGHRHGSDLMWLWLWCRPAAVGPIRPLAWEPPYASNAALGTKIRKPDHWTCNSLACLRGAAELFKFIPELVLLEMDSHHSAVLLSEEAAWVLLGSDCCGRSYWNRQ